MSFSLTQCHRIGIIGYGGYGTFLARTWKELPNVEIVALAGRSRDGVENAAKEWGIPHAYSGEDSARQLIHDPSVEVVAITSPPSDHAEMALMALEAGKHVFCEKPLATTLEDAHRVAEKVRESGLRLAMGFVLRYEPLFHHLKQIIEANVFGELHRISFQNFAGDEALPPDHWFWDVKQSGGILVEHGVHFFDIYSWLVGSGVRRVTGHRTVRPGTTQEDRVLATVEHENGTLATYYHAFDKPSRLERTTAHLAFDRGYVEVEGWIALSMAFSGVLEAGGREKLDALLPGWTDSGSRAFTESERAARGGGHNYRLLELIEGKWVLSQDKQAVYEQCAKDNLLDLLYGIENPSHSISADVEAGLRSVSIATAIPLPTDA